MTIDTMPTATISRDGELGGDETDVVTTDRATGRELTRYAVAGPHQPAAVTRPGLIVDLEDGHYFT